MLPGWKAKSAMVTSVRHCACAVRGSRPLGNARQIARARPVAQPLGTIPAFVWTLIAFPGVGAITEPRYTVQFLPDGLVDILADCNRARGVWSGGEGALTITMTTSTMAARPPESLSQAYLQALNGVTGYTLTGTTLVLHGAAGDMTFTA
jgi:heat shock protein HslJ